MSKWEMIARLIEVNNGPEYVDWTHNFFICPYCHEPIEENMWSNIDLTDGLGNFLCPCCESWLGQEDD